MLGVDLGGVARAVDALRQLDSSGGSLGLEDPYVTDSLFRLFPADQITLCELDLQRRGARQRGLVPAEDEEVTDDQGAEAPFWEHFWHTVGCSYTERIARLRREVMMTGDFYTTRQWHSTGLYSDYLRSGRIEKSLIMPLPGPPGTARRLIFARGPGRAFTERHRSAATMLQPHIADALRLQARRASAMSLTARQQELLQLVAAGLPNRIIARQLGLSPATVRKHLENVFARLGVSSRTEAVAKVRPDSGWC